MRLIRDIMITSKVLPSVPFVPNYSHYRTVIVQSSVTIHLYKSKKAVEEQTDRHKITKGPQANGRTDEQTYYTATQGI